MNFRHHVERFEACRSRLSQLRKPRDDTASAAPEYQLRMLRRFDAEKPTFVCKSHLEYRFIPYEPSLDARWIALLNSSNEFGQWDEKRFAESMLSLLVPGSPVFAEYKNSLVACCAAFELDAYKPYAILAYPLVLAAHRKRGLGAAVTNRTLEACRRSGYPGVMLHTQENRKAAIQTYLKLGFVPDLEADDDAAEHWRLILAATNVDPKGCVTGANSSSGELFA